MACTSTWQNRPYVFASTPSFPRIFLKFPQNFLAFAKFQCSACHSWSNLSRIIPRYLSLPIDYNGWTPHKKIPSSFLILSIPPQQLFLYPPTGTFLSMCERCAPMGAPLALQHAQIMGVGAIHPPGLSPATDNVTTQISPTSIMD